LTLLHGSPDLVHSAFISGVSLEPIRPRWLWSLVASLLATLVAMPLLARATARVLRLDPPSRALYIADAKRLRRRTARSIYREVIDFRLPTLAKVPLLIAAGARESAGALRSLQIISRAYPHAQTLLVPSAGHVWFVEQPAMFLSSLRAFLDAGLACGDRPPRHDA